MSLGDSYLEVFDELCDKTYCYYGTEEIFYFADASHLSKNAVVKFDNIISDLTTVMQDQNKTLD